MATVVMDDVDASASDIRKAFVMSFGEPKEISENGRVLISKYHDQKGKFEESASTAKIRRYTKIEIMGDRRPFNVNMDVHVEQMQSDKSYEDIDTDERLANEMAKRLKKSLNQSLGNRNAIDDLRAF